MLDGNDNGDAPEVGMDNDTGEIASPEVTAEELSDAYSGETGAVEPPGGPAGEGTLEHGGKAAESVLDGGKEGTLESGTKPEDLEAGAKGNAPPGETAAPEHLTTINEDLAGLEHPETGVRYEHSTITLDGKQYDVVEPKFESLCDAALEKEDYAKSDYLQAKICNEKLQDAVQNDPELASKFTADQLDQIRNGDTPKGYTWHHAEQPGQMQLVDSGIHAATRHTGGRVLWGGGKENR